MNEQTLELQIKSQAQEATLAVDKLVRSLTNIEGVLTNVYLELGSIEKKSDKSLSSLSKQIDNIKPSSNKATTGINGLSKALSLGSAYASVKRLSKIMSGWFKETIDRTEQMNLFNVVFSNIEKDGVSTFSKLGSEATRFQNKLNEAFGTNKTETLKYQALFKSMGDNVGIPEEYSALMSETMTKFTYDLASLYNKTESTTGEALRAGVYAGQTKPLRGFGIDVTQTSMQPILDELGIERSVKQLSQAEKEILRYIATLRQGKVAMGDFANTIESPSNQLKVFRQQLVEAKVAFTSLFMGTFSSVLPYANALLMVIKEMSKALADILGIKLSDYNSGIASQEDAYVDLEDSIAGATDAVKELKRQTLGFDEIHNINENADNGSGLGVTEGIDQRLLDAIKGYDNGMDRVRMKATEIRDKIMDWLGFHQEIDSLTGDTVWRLDQGYTTIEKILDTIKLIGVTLLAWKISKPIVSFFTKALDPDTGKSFVKNIRQTAGLTILITSLTYSFDAIRKTLKDGPDLSTASEGILSAVGTGIGTYLITKDAKLTLVIMGVNFVLQAGASLSKLWEELSPAIEENGGFFANYGEGVATLAGDIKGYFNGIIDDAETLTEYIGIYLSGSEEKWNMWKDAIHNVFDFVTLDHDDLKDRLKEDFGKINQAIEENGGYWESWKEGMGLIIDDAKKRFEEKWNASSLGQLNQAIEENGGYWESWKEGMQTIIEDIGISRFFTKEYWKEKFNGLTNGAKEVLEELRTKFENFTANIKTPHITWTADGIQATGTIKKILEAINLPTSLPKLNVSWYANGGFPEDGLFLANHSELVGKFSNGKTAVANNLQIIEGIKAGVYTAVIEALSQSGGAGQVNQIDVHVHTDEGTVIDRIEQRTKQTGSFPFTIPTK